MLEKKKKKIKTSNIPSSFKGLLFAFVGTLIIAGCNREFFGYPVPPEYQHHQSHV